MGVSMHVAAMRADVAVTKYLAKQETDDQKQEPNGSDGQEYSECRKGHPTTSPSRGLGIRCAASRYSLDSASGALTVECALPEVKAMCLLPWRLSLFIPRERSSASNCNPVGLVGGFQYSHGCFPDQPGYRISSVKLPNSSGNGVPGKSRPVSTFRAAVRDYYAEVCFCRKSIRIRL